MTRRRHALIDPYVLSGVSLRKKNVPLYTAGEFVDVHIHNIGPNTLEYRIDLSPGKTSLHAQGAGFTDWNALYHWESKTAPTTLAAGVSVTVNIPEDWAHALRLWINDTSVQASGTVTLASVLAGDTVTVNGLDYTAVAGTKTDNTEFSIDNADGIDALDLADSINKDTRTGVTVPAFDVYAEVSGAVVTIYADDAGTGGNSIDLSSSNGIRLAVSGANLASGTSVNAPTRYHAYVNFIS